MANNPTQDYVLSTNPPMSKNGLISDGVYAVTGVYNSTITKGNTYQDPSTNQYSDLSDIITPNGYTPTEWYSDVMDDETYPASRLDFIFSRSTYINYVSFDILEVPCVWEIYKDYDTTPVKLTTGVINGNNNTNWIHFGRTFDTPYLFDVNSPLTLIITKLPNNTTYSFGVRNFLSKLQIKSNNDIPKVGLAVVSGFTTQNNLGYAESYSYSQYSLDNVLSSDIQDFWKCEPQPVGDAIVYFVVDFGSLKTFNKIFLDPLFTGNVFNIYFSYDNETWTPVQRDFNLKKGIYELPTITGRYIKFEFTKLTAQPYDFPFDSVRRTVLVYPDWVDSYFTEIERAIPNIADQGYFPLNTNLGSSVPYNTQTSVNTLAGLSSEQFAKESYGDETTNLIGGVGINIPNSNVQITDPTVSYKTITNSTNVGGVYTAISDINFINRKFPTTCKHNYKEVTLDQTWHEAYFTGIKQLLFFSTNYNVQYDYEEFTDYFLSNSSNSTIVSGTATTATFRPLSTYTNGYGVTTISGGGYTGLAGTVVQTNVLKTYTPFNSFKIASLASNWQPFLSRDQTLLNNANPAALKITASGLSITNIDTQGAGYGIYKITPSGAAFDYATQDWIQSGPAGGRNLLTTAMATFAGVSGWYGPNPATSANITLSGYSYVDIPIETIQPYQANFGSAPFGDGAYGSSTTSNVLTSAYTFLLTASGVGHVALETDYYSVSGATETLLSGQISPQYNINGVTLISGVSYQPINSSRIRLKILPSGITGVNQLAFSFAGLFLGPATTWVAPIVTNNMRIAAVARIYIPNPLNGATSSATYRCSIMSNGQEVVYRQATNLPGRTWIDIEVPFTLTGDFANYSSFNTRLTQLNGNGEEYEVAMLGLFYNPIAYEYTSDNWNTSNPIVMGINDPYFTVNMRNATTSGFAVKMTLLEDNANISALSVVPVYPQSPYSTTTLINFLNDPKSGELSWRRPPQQKPLFQLNQDPYPPEYSITNVMGIANPYEL